MKTSIKIATSNGYILDNGKLTAYEFKSAKVDFSTGSVEYDCILGGKPTTFKKYDGDCPKVYADETAYQKGKTKQREYTFGNAVGACFFGVPYDVDGMIPAYCVVDGEPVRTNLPLTGYVLRWCDRWTYEGEGAFYETRDEAMLYCDIVKVAADGTETVIPSPASLVALNEEQKKAVQAVEDALENARRLGVSFACDIECERLYAYSGKRIKAYEYEYDCDEHITAFGYRINGLMSEMSLSPMCANLCETQVYAKFKEE